MRPYGPLLLGLGLLAARWAAAQKPVIAKDGIVNAASFASLKDMARPVAEGSIATIFGENLADQTLAAGGYPLPRELGETAVTVDGVPAPLFYVSPRQVNFQVPWGARVQNVSGRVSLVVRTVAGVSDPAELRIWMPAPGIFTQDGSGCGQGAVLNVAPDGTTSVNSPANSVSPGGIITYFALGAGSILNPPPDGEPAPLDRLVVRDPTAADGASPRVAGQSVPRYLFRGLAPGLVGVHQYNVELPPDTPESCTVPLRLASLAAVSQDVAISVRRGGGQCVDPPPESSSSAVLEWRWTQSSGIEPAPPPELFTASFVRVPDTRFLPLSPNLFGRHFLPHPLLREPWAACECFTELPRFKSCPQFEDQRLDVGALTLEAGSGVPIRVQASAVDGKLTYQAALPRGTIREGNFTVTSSGGSGIGVFQTGAAIPPPIQLLTSFPPGVLLSSGQPVEIHWTGGRAGDLVRLRLKELGVPDRPHSFCECSVPATAGAVVIPLVDWGPQFRPSLPFSSHADHEITVTHEATADNIARFTAGGLSAGGQHRWVYQWRFGRQLGYNSFCAENPTVTPPCTPR